MRCPAAPRGRRCASLWRTLLQNHPHDSICGCSIDDVHDVDMAPRFARVRGDGEALSARLARELAEVRERAGRVERGALGARRGRRDRWTADARPLRGLRHVAGDAAVDGAGVSSPDGRRDRERSRFASRSRTTGRS